MIVFACATSGYSQNSRDHSSERVSSRLRSLKKIEEGADGNTGKRLFGMFRGLEKTLA